VWRQTNCRCRSGHHRPHHTSSHRRSPGSGFEPWSH